MKRKSKITDRERLDWLERQGNKKVKWLCGLDELGQIWFYRDSVSVKTAKENLQGVKDEIDILIESLGEIDE